MVAFASSTPVIVITAPASDQWRGLAETGASPLVSRSIRRRCSVATRSLAL
jgi:hypothetical protein